MSTIVPIGGGRRQLPQAGRIRLGKKGGKQGRQAIDRFRFTSPERRLLEPVAELYGGQVTTFSDAKSGDRYELMSEATEINVILPVDPLTESYELWSGERGLERRCDGVDCTVLVRTGDGYEPQQEDCLCARAGALKCKYKLRLSMLIPEVESLGVWRLDTSSEHARQEIPTVVETIENLQGRGFYTAVLRLEQRTAPGKRFNVPVLDPGVSVAALSAGAARLAGLPGSAQARPPELVRGEGVAGGEDASSPPAPSPDDDILDGEVIEEVDPTIGRAWLDNLPTKEKNAALRRAHELATEMGEPIPTSAAAIPESIVNRLAAERLT